MSVYEKGHNCISFFFSGSPLKQTNGSIYRAFEMLKSDISVQVNVMPVQNAGSVLKCSVIKGKLINEQQRAPCWPQCV